MIQSVFSQTRSDSLNIYNSFFYNLKTLNFYKNTLNLQNESKTKDLLTSLNYLLADNTTTTFDKLPNKIKKITPTNKDNDFIYSIENIILGYKNLFYGNRIKSYKYFYSALTSAKKTEYIPLIKLSLRSILTFYKKGIAQNDDTFKIYLNDYYNFCEDPSDNLIYYSYKLNLIAQTTLYNEKEEPLKDTFEKIFIKYDSVKKKVNNKLRTIYYIDKGNFLIRHKTLEAKEKYEKAWRSCSNEKYYNKHKLHIKWNLSRVYSLLNKHKKGLNEIYNSYKYISPNDTIKSLFANYHYSADHHANLKNYDSAYYYMRKSLKYSYLMNFQKHNTEISKIREELETEKKEKTIAQQKQKITSTEIKQKQTTNLLITSLLILLLGGAIALLTIKNSRKKHQLALKEKTLEQQKNSLLLKEQEINAINAMVEGQEKERKRIAEDLHDNVGSVLATLKLHFENLKFNREKKQFNQEELYNRTEKLIDETYAKIRHIAHEKNAGVIANQGLLVAVKIMAEKISSANKTQVEVIDFGLNKPIENALEISVFRIIQELVTNVLKHADAKNTTINISLYEDELNIIIEDDGKGFDTSKVVLKNGMGLNSIKTRVQHLKGSFNIDSSINNGTSIIITIPIT